jgi:hypothetical protein
MKDMKLSVADPYGGISGISAAAGVYAIMKQLWAENGDVLSVQYTGTGSTITEVTKSGK